MIQFANWQITAPRGVIARQYDNLSRTLLVTGELPEGYDWELLVQVGQAMDIIRLTPMAGGVGVTLTADQLSLSGYYQLQLRGTRGEAARHTNVISVFIPASLSGSGQWPTVPSEFTQIQRDVLAAAARTEAAAGRAEEAAGRQPYPDPDTGTWWVWDGTAGAYRDSGVSSTGAGGVTDHAQLTGRDAEDQHPIGAITQLRQELNSRIPIGSEISALDIINMMEE